MKMGKGLVPLAALLLSLSSLTAQNYCGSPAGRSAWLKKYQSHPEAFEKGTDTTMYVPLTIHLLGSDDGTGFFKLYRVFDAFCSLNRDYEQAGIQFYIQGDIDYISNTAWNDHEEIETGAEMMFANNVENTLNVYFVANPAGNCGYNLPYGGIALNKSCSNPDDHTWAHEVGHALSLPHPFLGWEGGVSYDNSVAYDYADPAPEYVTYDYTLFKSVFYPDTLIIDTAFVEKLDGSNCHIASDGFCDTPPDYLYNRWNCDINSLSSTLQTDPNGANFRSDGTLIMGYANDVCQGRFTPEQIAAMRAYLVNEKPEWINDQTPPDSLTMSVAVPVYPTGDELVNYQDIELTWNAVPGAVSYLVMLSTSTTFQDAALQEFVSTDTTLLIDELLINRRYYWRVKPFTRYQFCEPTSGTAVFRSAQVTGANRVAGIEEWRLYPNPAGESSNIRLSATLLKNMPISYRIHDAAGKLVGTGRAELYAGHQDISLNMPELPKGVYWIQWTDGVHWMADKVVI